MASYRVRYSVLPGGVGPDEYEPADLEQGELVLDLSDPEPIDLVIGGRQQSYGPHVNEVTKAVVAAVQLADGDEPIIISWDPI
ncbi:hypothetical protein [Streptomyces stelliscabiei]|uniref:hypothetical protein n=1 Tax=Streptomyces stelliscabiei TaxID=146820 RepID=UPI0029B9C8B5|nr:hypothetical protein [Streptomyces stelliscabiei]MDX2667376.1 hypothetical protein [Streptomyces stelliscabiei]MDX2785915.1 hypothetical protein [Streptomyces stelliscabiei]